MMKPILVISIFMSLSLAKASTFVGNGGNAGDVELEVTLSQITSTLIISSVRQKTKMKTMPNVREFSRCSC